jgi:cytochrome b
MSWNKWIRQTHRWLSIIMTAAILFNLIEVLAGKYARWTGLLAVVPFVLQLITGLYLFALPYVARRRSTAQAD